VCVSMSLCPCAHTCLYQVWHLLAVCVSQREAAASMKTLVWPLLSPLHMRLDTRESFSKPPNASTVSCVPLLLHVFWWCCMLWVKVRFQILSKCLCFCIFMPLHKLLHYFLHCLNGRYMQVWNPGIGASNINSLY